MTTNFLFMTRPSELLVAYNLIAPTANYIILGFLILALFQMGISILTFSGPQPATDLVINSSTSTI